MDRIERAAQQTNALHGAILEFEFSICDWKLRGFDSTCAFKNFGPRREEAELARNTLPPRHLGGYGSSGDSRFHLGFNNSD
jgi:hypothetical protein